ncbi:hypothetical protein SEA_PUPPER_163 [Gordonia phage Pupper]|uniref:DUF932 domain-containing protein n=1 Tax=Gordonia phage Pupper TaxID=2571249 RepID=A0A4Y6ESA9_9CAUD|nr:hypothetical protein KHQ83_gp114 [Gordonia phage Pupper]QDF18649.1 hypothetical protein SEA_PUPPER_163 [Gordonia phage Pupper]QDF18881.1 hypothetical protein SEA_SCENTAE_162 [Gordonia phage SCentae]
MLVSELREKVLAGREEAQITTNLGNLQVDDEASILKVVDSGREFPFDAQVESALAKYLGVNKSYLAKCPPELKAHNLNYWMQESKPEAPGTIEVIGDQLVTIHKPGLAILPLNQVVELLTRAMKPEYEIVTLLRDDTAFHCDVVTDHSVQVPGDDRIEGRPAEGDITKGGVRMIAYPNQLKAPTVSTYLHRLWCTNGSTSLEAEDTIQLKGNTVETLLVEMEEAAQRIMQNLDSSLAAYAEMANTPVPGSPTKFAYQLGREYNLGQRLMDRIVERTAVLPDDASMYDVQQIFTQLANGNVNYKTTRVLQQIGGAMALDTAAVTHRCGSCERLLPEA